MGRYRNGELKNRAIFQTVTRFSRGPTPVPFKTPLGLVKTFL